MASRLTLPPPFVGPLLVGGPKLEFSPDFRLDERGYGTWQVRTSSLTLGNTSAAVQGIWGLGQGAIFLTDNYVLTAHWTNADASQILAAQYNSESHGFLLRGATASEPS